jgi:hypothetical protein
LNPGALIVKRVQESMRAHAAHIEYKTPLCCPAVAAVLYAATRCGETLAEPHKRILLNMGVEAVPDDDDD